MWLASRSLSSWLGRIVVVVAIPSSWVVLPLLGRILAVPSSWVGFSSLLGGIVIVAVSLFAGIVEWGYRRRRWVICVVIETCGVVYMVQRWRWRSRLWVLCGFRRR